ncbi:ubiquitin-binding serine/threonine protein kinase VPS15 [Lachancea thermotolerans CBS 6340]|uniref:non-specific serine/threonine protein kinase n=1 Tax=Lachancea thermotolerans (strain ATCC 56472 / CBS 6340 / NRRL Y-8284) TaxID=559295 RepID=C5DIT4_LACTC|nr:KLTH0E15026p [Lachancea thermotolerans CBS 6340]CAR23695.1 KLTH0E15026p [Lachancea thermotolerans CBS 6340]
MKESRPSNVKLFNLVAIASWIFTLSKESLPNLRLQTKTLENQPRDLRNAGVLHVPLTSQIPSPSSLVSSAIVSYVKKGLYTAEETVRWTYEQFYTHYSMGAQLSLIAHTAPSIAISSYVDVLDDIHYLSQLNSSRFLKTCKALDPNGEILIKVFIKPTDEYSLTELSRQLTKESLVLAPLPNVLNYSKIVESDRAGYLIRQHLKSSAYDKLSSRPSLEPIELKFIIFQLLRSLDDIHSRGVCHGDLKLENLMLTSWNWLVVTDFSSLLKPTYLPDDNPGEFSFYFDTSQRRSCYVAPERFDSEQFHKNVQTKPGIKPEMDIFSAGCCIAEILSEGYSVFNLSQLFRYRNGEYNPSEFLDKNVTDPLFKELIMSMICLDPQKRSSVREILAKYRGSLFPEILYTFYYEYFKNLAICGGGSPSIGKTYSSSTLSSQVFEGDRVVEKIFKDLPKICASLGYPLRKVEPGDKTYDQKQQLIISLPFIGTIELQKFSAISSSLNEESALLLLSILLHSLRTINAASTRQRCMVLILALSQYVSDSNKLDRIIPYIVSMFFDESPSVQALSVQVLSQILTLVTELNRVNENIFVEYLIPRLKKLISSSKHSEYVRMVLAENIGNLARSAVRFQDISYASYFEEEHDVQGLEILQKMKMRLIHGFEEITIAFLTDNQSSVKIALLSDILPLCDLFVREKTNDVILSHLITYLNDKNSSLRIKLIQVITGVAVLLGPITLEQYILPLLIQTATDSEELVVVTVLKSLKSLCTIGLIQKKYFFDISSIVSPLLLHPNIWIRQFSLILLIEISHKLSKAEIYCLLYPIIRPYFEFDVQLTWESMVSSCKKPVSRTVYNILCTWSLRSTNSLFWKQVPSKQKDSFGNSSAIFINKEYTTKNYGFGGAYKLSKTSLKLADNREIMLTNEDKGWLDKIKTVGLKENELWKIAALRAYVFRVAKMIARKPDAIIPNNPLLGNEALSKRGFSSYRLPRNVFFDVQFLNDETHMRDSTHVIIKHSNTPEQAISERIPRTKSIDLNKSLLLNAKAAPTLNSNLDNVYVQLECSKSKPLLKKKPASCQSEVSPSKYVIKNSYEGGDCNVESYLRTIDVKPPFKAYPEFGPFSNLRGGTSGKTAFRSLAQLNFAFQVAEQKSAAINALSACNSRSFILSGSDEGAIKLWDMEKILKGETFLPTASFHAGSSIVDIVPLAGCDVFAVAAKDGSIFLLKIIDSESKGSEPSTSSLRVVRKYLLDDASEHVIKLATTPRDDEPMIYALTNTSKLFVIDPRTMQPTKIIKSDPLHGCVLSFVVSDDEAAVILGTSRGIIDVWDLRFKILVYSWTFADRAPIVNLNLYPSFSKRDGMNIVIVGGSSECIFTIWDFSKCQCKYVVADGEFAPSSGSLTAQTLKADDKEFKASNIEAGPISSIVVEGDNILVTDNETNSIICFNVKEGTAITAVLGVNAKKVGFKTLQLTATTKAMVKQKAAERTIPEITKNLHHNTINSAVMVRTALDWALVSADRSGIMNIYR